MSTIQAIKMGLLRERRRSVKIQKSRVFNMVNIFDVFVCLFDLILYGTSTIFQLNGDGFSWVGPVLS